MPDKLMRMSRSKHTNTESIRPVVLAVAGDSASGKTTLTAGLVDAIGTDRCTSICVDDYHRLDRRERAALGLTASDPDCNYVDIMEQHLQMLATGQPILKPVYDHATGELVRPEYVEPRQFVIVEGLLPLFSKLSRACFDVKVYLDPQEEVRRTWKIDRDTARRGYTHAEAVAELDRRESASAEFIRPQRRYADIVVRFATETESYDPPQTPLSADILMRATAQHPPLNTILTDDVRTAMHLTIIRDSDGTPVDCLHVHGGAPPEDIHLLEKAIWDGVADRRELPSGLGELAPGRRSEPLAVIQLLLLYHLVQEVY